MKSAGPKQEWHSLLEVCAGESKLWCCKEQYCIGIWNVTSMNQGTLDMVKQETVRLNSNILGISSVQSLSHVQLCNPMNCSTPGFSIYHWLLELAQTHVHWISNTIQPSHPLSSPPPPTLSLPSIRVFSKESALHIRWLKYWSFSFNISPSNEHPGLIFRMDWLDLLAVQGTLKSLLQPYSSKASILQRSAFFSPSWLLEKL